MRADKGKRRAKYSSDKRRAMAIARKDAADLRNTLIDVLTFEIEELRKQIPMPFDEIIRKQDELLALEREPRVKKERRKRVKPLQDTPRERPQDEVKEPFNRKQYRKDKRLVSLPANRICPGCEQLKIKNKQWVINQTFGIICKSCYWDMKKNLLQCSVESFAKWIREQSLIFDPKPLLRNALIKRFVETCKDASEWNAQQQPLNLDTKPKS